jgi:hypothetical protein
MAAAAPAQEAEPYHGLWAPLHRVMDRFEFLPGFHLSADVLYFAAHRGPQQRERFFIETDSDMDLTLLGYRRRLYSVWSLYVRTGMGRQEGAVMFDPRDVRYGVVPWLELRLDRVHLRAGLEHFCFHDIDRDDRVTEYWNKEVAEAASPNFRLSEFRRRLVSESLPATGDTVGPGGVSAKAGRWGRGDRAAWLLGMGHYMDKAFGLLPEPVLGGGQNYNWEGWAEGRWAIFRSRDWVVAARGRANLNISDAYRPMQTYVVGLEGHFRRGAGGSMLFLYWNAEDQLTVRPKDGLVELGLKFYN